PLCDVLASVVRCVAGQLKCFLCTVRSFDGHGLAGAIDMGNGSVHRFETILADVIDLDCCLFSALFGVVRHYLGAFLESVKGVFGAHGCFMDTCFDTMDTGFVDELNGMLGAILCLDDNCLGGGIQLRNGPVDGTDHVLCGPAQRT